MGTLSENWRPIKKFEIGNLQKAREHMHEAIQLVALVGRGFLPDSKEDDNATLEWLPDFEVFAGHWVGDHKKFRAALDLEDLRYFILDQALNEYASINLAGKSQFEAFNWIRLKFFELRFEISSLSQNLPYVIPEYKYKYFRFDYSNSAYKTLSELFGNAHMVLQRVESSTFNISETRCWPHHFDIAAFISLEDNQQEDVVRRIGLGFSPGDEAIPEPYFYTNCWPYLDLQNQDPPQISNGGRWNLEGWVGTVLTYSILLTVEDQYLTTKEFLISSIKAFRQI